MTRVSIVSGGTNIKKFSALKVTIRMCRVIRLEQNYRSTQNILDASNAVIRNNEGRKGKTLWTENGAGDKVHIQTVYNESAEADYVASCILKEFSAGRDWKDNAVLYRMNAQSNQLLNMHLSGMRFRIRSSAAHASLIVRK